jgi:hypothetical protein
LASLKGLVSQFGAYLGGHFATPAALNAAIFVLSRASTMIFLIPRRNVVVSEELDRAGGGGVGNAVEKCEQHNAFAPQQDCHRPA